MQVISNFGVKRARARVMDAENFFALSYKYVIKCRPVIKCARPRNGRPMFALLWRSASGRKCFFRRKYHHVTGSNSHLKPPTNYGDSSASAREKGVKVQSN